MYKKIHTVEMVADTKAERASNTRTAARPSTGTQENQRSRANTLGWVQETK